MIVSRKSYKEVFKQRIKLFAGDGFVALDIINGFVLFLIHLMLNTTAINHAVTYAFVRLSVEILCVK
jgi:hypothetical protein